LSYSISGAATYYAGGGGGMSVGSGTPGQGGQGGGATYPGANLNGNPGIANTGGGGSAAQVGFTGGSGGSGIVIISAPIGTVTATGGSHTTAGGNDIWTFTSSGTWTPHAVYTLVAGYASYGFSTGTAGMAKALHLLASYAAYTLTGYAVTITRGIGHFMSVGTGYFTNTTFGAVLSAPFHTIWNLVVRAVTTWRIKTSGQ
jgi:hypothetical protein